MVIFELWVLTLESFFGSHRAESFRTKHFYGSQISFDYAPDGTLPNAYHGIVYHRFTKYGAWKEAKTFVTIFDGGQSIIDFFSERKNQCEIDDYNCKDDINIFFTIGHWNPAFATWGATEFLPGAREILINTMQIPEDLLRLVFKRFSKVSVFLLGEIILLKTIRKSRKFVG